MTLTEVLLLLELLFSVIFRLFDFWSSNNKKK